MKICTENKLIFKGMALGATSVILGIILSKLKTKFTKKKESDVGWNHDGVLE